MEIAHFSFEARLTVNGAVFRFIDLPGLFGNKLRQLPGVLRLLLENLIRNTEGEERRQAVEGIREWTARATT